jgi:hypothetical protein
MVRAALLDRIFLLNMMAMLVATGGPLVAAEVWG